MRLREERETIHKGARSMPCTIEEPVGAFIRVYDAQLTASKNATRAELRLEG